MSAYHRLISYIYAYEGGIKGKNTGFAKLETRGTSCRIQVSVRRVFAGGSPIGVYLLAGGDPYRHPVCPWRKWGVPCRRQL